MSNEKTIELLNHLIKLRMESLTTAKDKLRELKSSVINCEKDIDSTQLEIDEFKSAIQKLKNEKDVIVNESGNTGINKASKK